MRNVFSVRLARIVRILAWPYISHAQPDTSPIVPIALRALHALWGDISRIWSNQSVWPVRKDYITMLLRPRIRQHVAPVPVDTMQVRIKASSPCFLLLHFHFLFFLYLSFSFSPAMTSILTTLSFFSFPLSLYPTLLPLHIMQVQRGREYVPNVPQV